MSNTSCGPWRPILQALRVAGLLVTGGLPAMVQATSHDQAAGRGFMARAGDLWDDATDAQAWQDRAYWRFAVAPYTPHFRPSSEHRHAYAVAAESQRDDHWLAGLSLFRNSFGQPSAYAYLGRRHPELLGLQPLFFQWSAGVLYGYKGEYKNKVALNVNGFAPGALVGLGWQFNRQASATVHLLGDAALMFQFAWDLR